MGDGDAIAEAGGPQPLALDDRNHDAGRIEPEPSASDLAELLEQLSLVGRAEANADRIEVEEFSEPHGTAFNNWTGDTRLRPVTGRSI